MATAEAATMSSISPAASVRLSLMPHRNLIWSKVSKRHGLTGRSGASALSVALEESGFMQDLAKETAVQSALVPHLCLNRAMEVCWFWSDH